MNDAVILNWLQKRFQWLVADSVATDEVTENRCPVGILENHIIVVGMNSLGRNIVSQLVERGEQVLAIDTDPVKLAGLPSVTMLGNIEYLATLEEAGLPAAKLLVSALQIEDANELLAYRCQSFGVPSSIHAVDMQMLDNLLALDVNYLMIPKVDGVKLLNQKLIQMDLIAP